MTLALCGKPTQRNTACQARRMPRFDGCQLHRTVTPDVLAIDAARERLKDQRCAELHARSPWLEGSEWHYEIDTVQRWASHFRPDAKPACWEWDASESAVASIRASVMEDRARRTPAGTSAAELVRDLDWEVFIVWHQHRCASCGTAGDLEVDHDHRTKLIRGLLCGACNQHEGLDERNRGRRTLYHFSPPSYAMERYRTKNPATQLGMRRNYSRKKTFPYWCQLAERAPIGAAPAELRKKTAALVFGGEPLLSRRNVEAFRQAEQAQRELEKGVRAMQEVFGHFRCGRLRSCNGPDDFRAVEPVVAWVRERFPGLHERTAERARDQLNQVFAPWPRPEHVGVSE